MELRIPGVEGSFSSVHTDSRDVRPGGLFFALRGSAKDGHEYVADAISRGAAGVVIERPVEGGTARVITVSDTWSFLYELAGRVLAAAAPLVVAVTGSNGKTTTKEMTAAVLKTRYQVLKTEGNLNTETGVPLTLLQLEPGRHNALVVEMGMQGPGQIARLAELAAPRVGIVTNIGRVHMEFFDSLEDLARAKGELLERLPPDGLAVLNYDDALTPLLRELSRAPVVTFGLEGGDYHSGWYEAGVFTVRETRVDLKVQGRHQARNALAALAAGEFAGVPLEEGAQALAEVAVDRRLQAITAPSGFAVVDDAYNASPESMLAAFEVVAGQQGKRRLAVLGEMRELGKLAEAAHREVGEQARRVFDAVCVIDVGFGKVLAEASGGELVADQQAAVEWVLRHAAEGDLVLVKGSHGLHLDEVVERLAQP